MAIPRRLIVVAVSAVAAGAMLYVSSRMKQMQQDQNKKRGAVDDTNDSKDTAEQNKKQQENAAKTADSAGSSSSSKGIPSEGALRELSLFLAGDAWHDEIGWQALWEKDGIAAADAWLKEMGKDVLVNERKKLTEHPALLAGCRRRWIVVCRYAGIDVGDAANLWNAAEA